MIAKSKIFLILNIAVFIIGLFPFINTLKKINSATDIEILSSNYSKLNSILSSQKKINFYTNLPDSLGGIEWYYKSQLCLAPMVLIKKPYPCNELKLCLIFNNYKTSISNSDSILSEIKSNGYSILIVKPHAL